MNTYTYKVYYYVISQKAYLYITIVTTTSQLHHFLLNNISYAQSIFLLKFSVLFLYYTSTRLSLIRMFVIIVSFNTNSTRFKGFTQFYLEFRKKVKNF